VPFAAVNVPAPPENDADVTEAAFAGADVRVSSAGVSRVVRESVPAIRRRERDGRVKARECDMRLLDEQGPPCGASVTAPVSLLAPRGPSDQMQVPDQCVTVLHEGR
jgi:hypothetical protein